MSKLNESEIWIYICRHRKREKNRLELNNTESLLHNLQDKSISLGKITEYLLSVSDGHGGNFLNVNYMSSKGLQSKEKSRQTSRCQTQKNGKSTKQRHSGQTKKAGETGGKKKRLKENRERHWHAEWEVAEGLWNLAHVPLRAVTQWSAQPRTSPSTADKFTMVLEAHTSHRGVLDVHASEHVRICFIPGAIT